MPLLTYAHVDGIVVREKSTINQMLNTNTSSCGFHYVTNTQRSLKPCFASVLNYFCQESTFTFIRLTKAIHGIYYSSLWIPATIHTNTKPMPTPQPRRWRT